MALLNTIGFVVVPATAGAVRVADPLVEPTRVRTPAVPTDPEDTPPTAVRVVSFKLPVKSPAVPLPIAKDAALRREMPVSVDHSKTAVEGSCTFELMPDPLCVKANVESPLTCVITGVPVVA
jgi:hypothetical protein